MSSENDLVWVSLLSLIIPLLLLLVVGLTDTSLKRSNNWLAKPHLFSALRYVCARMWINSI